ncbi:MAG: hypothetical protein U0232_12580 [Thermomicrobiales bacterium]
MDRSLLRRQDDAPTSTAEPRLMLLETLREYGLERLAEAGEEDAARNRHAAHFLALAEAAESALQRPDGADWRERLEREHDNLRAALGWLLGRGEGERALRLTGALWHFWLGARPPERGPLAARGAGRRRGER